VSNLKGKKSKKEPRVKQEKVEKEKNEEIETEKEKEKEVVNKKETVQELEKEIEQETKDISNELETELKKVSINNTSEFTQDHQENFGINPTQSKAKETNDKSSSSSQSKKEHQSSKNYHSSETPSFNPYSMFPPIFNPMMMPNPDGKGGQAPMYYMIPVPVDPSQLPKDYWQNMSMYYPMMQNMYQANFNKQNSNSKK